MKKRSLHVSVVILLFEFNSCEKPIIYILWLDFRSITVKKHWLFLLRQLKGNVKSGRRTIFLFVMLLRSFSIYSSVNICMIL